MVSYGSSARSALHVVKDRRRRGERLGLLELQTLWPFPRISFARNVPRPKPSSWWSMNMGQVMQKVKKAVDFPERVFPGQPYRRCFHHPDGYRKLLRLIQGKGV